MLTRNINFKTLSEFEENLKIYQSKRSSVKMNIFWMDVIFLGYKSSRIF